ncbi:MAG: hypothetical protein AUH92_03420 [Acidobacteria bacterium 13_1_40CM_4_69_4]|nr:MAG: hypothetical protein AUH92_03420 [Acidobacteria bacterium 13_1_40CM_4_69_4]
MKRRLGPILAVVLLLGLGVYTYLSEFRGKEEDKKAETEKDKPLPFDRAGLKAVRIKNANGEFRLEKQGDAWKLTAPLQADADKEAIEGLLSSLDYARVERRLGKEIARKQYGLDPPKTSLTIETASSGGAPTLAIGESNPIGGTYYALLPGSDEVAVVSSSLGEVAKKDLLTLRDKSLLTLDSWKVKRLSLERGRETIRLEKPDEGWVIRQPVEAPADGPTITDLLNALQNLRASGFDSERPTAADLRRFGLTPPQARMTLLQEGWDVEKTVIFGKVAPGGGRYARTLGREPVVTVPSDFWPKVTTKLSDLRRKDLLGVQQYRIESITIARNGGPATTLTRQKDQTWTLGGASKGTVKSETVDTLLRMVSDLKALSFDDNPKAQVRASLSRRPALDLSLQEETDTAGGKPKSQHLLIGRPGKKGQVLVRDMAWRPIATVAPGVLDKINGQVEALIKEAAAPKPGPGPSASPAPSVSPAPSPGK